MEKEIFETFLFNPFDYDDNGRRTKDGMTFRDVIKEFEHDFHRLHTTEYARNLYANARTMKILSNSCNAEPFLVYGMDLTKGKSFDPQIDPDNNHKMNQYSKYIHVYGIDSAFMTEFDEFGYPKLDEDSDIYPLTLLIDDSMSDGMLKLSVPTIDDDGDDEEDPEPVTTDVPQFEYA